MSNHNNELSLAELAGEGKLTVEVVNNTTKDKLERSVFRYSKNTYFDDTVLYWASMRSPVEVVEAILDKGVNIDDVSRVSYSLLPSTGEK
jgi:hypothetical protein